MEWILAKITLVITLLFVGSSVVVTSSPQIASTTPVIAPINVEVPVSVELPVSQRNSPKVASTTVEVPVYIPSNTGGTPIAPILPPIIIQVQMPTSSEAIPEAHVCETEVTLTPSVTPFGNNGQDTFNVSIQVDVTNCHDMSNDYFEYKVNGVISRKGEFKYYKSTDELGGLIAPNNTSARMFFTSEEVWKGTTFSFTVKGVTESYTLE